MFNKSEIMKQAHAKTRAFVAEKGGASRTVIYKNVFAIFLSREWCEVHSQINPIQHELAAAITEHQRRDISCAWYRNTADYKNYEARIQELKLAA